MTSDGPSCPGLQAGAPDIGRRPQAVDGTFLHAPTGQLERDPETGRVCCHLCGRWFVLLGAHVRVHGHTAASYRSLIGLCTSRALASTELSGRISGRQRAQYANDGDLRARLEHGHQIARTAQRPSAASPQTATPARQVTATVPEPQERVVGRRQRLHAARLTRQQVRDQQLADRLLALGETDLAHYLRGAYAGGASLQSLGRSTGLGRARLREALHDAGVPVRPPGANTAAGHRSRAVTADARAAEQLRTPDLHQWLQDHAAQGWSLSRLAATVGHSTHWVRWRLEQWHPPCDQFPLTATEDARGAGPGQR